MLFFDTNVIVYSIVNLDEEKLKISQQLVNTALEENSILISPLILQEMIFTLGKLGVESDVKIKYLAPSMSEINSERGINHGWIGAEFGMKPDDTLRERSGYDFGILTDAYICTGSQVDILRNIVFQGGR